MRFPELKAPIHYMQVCTLEQIVSLLQWNSNPWKFFWWVTKQLYEELMRFEPRPTDMYRRSEDPFPLSYAKSRAIEMYCI